MPTKSGVLGLLAAARGVRREDPLEELLDLQLAVRTDQRGPLLDDFHTAHHQVTGEAMPLSHRLYWADAVFTAYVGGRDEVIEGLAEALADPVYPLYLGRRSCVPEGRLVLGVDHGQVKDAVAATPWQASRRHQRSHRHDSTVVLDVQADVGVFADLEPARRLSDVPVSFNPERRQYAVREVVETTVVVANPSAAQAETDEGTPPSPADSHDPLGLVQEYA